LKAPQIGYGAGSSHRARSRDEHPLVDIRENDIRDISFRYRS
jgi:hypothetical protein